VPFAAATVWALYYMVLALPTLPRVPLALGAKLGLAIGLALSVRVGGFLLFAYLGLLLGAAGLLHWHACRDLRGLLGWSLLTGGRFVLPALLVGYAVMLAFWPWAQLSPLRHPLHSLAEFSHHAFGMPVLFDGDYYSSDALPWFYLPSYLLIRLPEVTLLLALLGLALALARQRLLGRPDARPAALGLALTAFAAVFPIGYAVAIGAVLFDGMRHFLFVLPPLACLAGLALDRLLAWLPDRGWRVGLAACLALYASYHVSLMVRLHPHQYVYYNALVGGIGGAQQRYKLDYWANSYAEAVTGLKRHLVARYGRAGFERRRFNVAVCGPSTSAAYFFPGNFYLVADRSLANFFIRIEEVCREVGGREVARVERLGVRLSTVLELAGPRQSAGRLPPL